MSKSPPNSGRSTSCFGESSLKKNQTPGSKILPRKRRVKDTKYIYIYTLSFQFHLFHVTAAVTSISSNQVSVTEPPLGFQVILYVASHYPHISCGLTTFNKFILKTWVTIQDFATTWCWSNEACLVPAAFWKPERCHPSSLPHQWPLQEPKLDVLKGAMSSLRERNHQNMGSFGTVHPL